MEHARTCKYFTEEVKYISKLVKLLYEDLGETSGGLLHIVLDDCNIYDEDIQWCIDQCNEIKNSNRKDRYICLEIATKMLGLSFEQRLLIYDMNGRFNCVDNCDECVIENWRLVMTEG